MNSSKTRYNWEQINRAFEEIIRSNNSKFVNWKAEKLGGKIIKPATFSPADLSFLNRTCDFCRRARIEQSDSDYCNSCLKELNEL